MATLAQARDLDRKGTAQLRVLARGLLILTAIPSALAVAGCSAALVQRNEVAAYPSVTASPAHQRAQPHTHRFRALLAHPAPPDLPDTGPHPHAPCTDHWPRAHAHSTPHASQPPD